MIQNESKVKIADNTGWKEGQVIRVLKGSNARFAWVWDIVVIAIKSASTWGQVEKWEVSHAVVVRTRAPIKRADWTTLRFDDNAVALIDAKKVPKGKRIFGPVAKELRDKGFKSVAILAEETI